MVLASTPAHADETPEDPVPATEPKPATKPATSKPRPASEPVGEEVIVVTGTRSESPRAAAPITTEVIDRQRLTESGVQTASEALALRPGLWLERGVAGTVGISIQGLGPQYSMVLVDGARQIGRTDGVLDLDRFGVEDIEQIEIVRGPSSVLYGADALGGVVNLVTRRPKDGLAIDALARLDHRMGSELRARVAGGARGTSGALIASWREADAISLAASSGDDPSPATTFNAYEDGHVTARASHRRGEHLRFDGSADYQRRDLRGVDANATGAVFDRRNLVETGGGTLAAAWSDAKTAVRLEGAASTYRDQYLSDQRMADALDDYAETDESLIEGRGQVVRELGRHRVLLGAEVLREALDSDRLSEPGERERGAIYAQDEWRLGALDQVVVVPAARLDVDSQFGVHATPRLAARWQIDKRSVVRGSVGMGYRAPNFKELLLIFENPGVGYVVEGNPDLDPESSINVQGGGEYQAATWLQVGGEAYLNRLRDMIFAVSLPNSDGGMLRFSYDNIGRARTAGFEVYALATHGRAGLELGWATTRARDLDSERPLEGIPANRFTATVRWRDRPQGFDAFVSAVFTGHRPFFLDPDDAQAETLTDRRVELRARVAKRFSTGLGAFLGIDNALDAGDAYIDRVLPRTLYAGMEVHR